jgi:hypothetical protein
LLVEDFGFVMSYSVVRPTNTMVKGRSRQSNRSIIPATRVSLGSSSKKHFVCCPSIYRWKAHAGMDRLRTDRIVKKLPSHDKCDFDGVIMDFGGEIPIEQAILKSEVDIHSS